MTILFHNYKGLSMRILSFFLAMLSLLFFTACEGPKLSGSSDKVKKEYFTGGKIHSEFFMSDSTGQNGILKKYGYEGHLTSAVNIKNGVKDGMEVWYNSRGGVIMNIPYVNGRKHGIQKTFYPNGDIMIYYTYKSGLKDGEAKTYRKNGSVHKQAMYKNDKLQ